MKTQYGSTKVMIASNVAWMPKTIVAMASLERFGAILYAVLVREISSATRVEQAATGTISQLSYEHYFLLNKDLRMCLLMRVEDLLELFVLESNAERVLWLFFSRAHCYMYRAGALEIDMKSDKLYRAGKAERSAGAPMTILAPTTDYPCYPHWTSEA